MHRDTRGALAFLGVFFGLLGLLAVASVGAWWFFTHVAPVPSVERRAALSRPSQAGLLSLIAPSQIAR